MSTISAKRKIKLYKNTRFLGLIKKYRVSDLNYKNVDLRIKSIFSFKYFNTVSIPLLKVWYIFDLLRTRVYKYICTATPSASMLIYYAQINLYSRPIIMSDARSAWIVNNLLVLSRPSKQLFVIFYKAKPVFIFTGGLMRAVMNEKRKSSKKLYKVAISLIKLASILTVKQQYFSKGILKLKNVGNLRIKILQTFAKHAELHKFIYISIHFRRDFTAQRFETRRAIKKYIKKRFKVS